MNFRQYTAGFRNLIVWKEAHTLTLMIYEVTKAFPQSERFGMTSQLQRAASSTEAQIAEGSRMSTRAFRKSYYDRSYGSNTEVDCFLELAKDLGYFDIPTYEKLLAQVNRTSFLLHKLIQSCT